MLLMLSGCDMVLFDPKGPIGQTQKDLLLVTTGLMLLVVVPVIVMIFAFAWKYRAKANAKYTPNWSHSHAIEVVVWVVPIIIILILAVITWRSTHALDPYKPLQSEVKPIEIQVIALNWKWMFVYPEQGIATVNEIAFPVGTPVNFRITSDSVMNSFFIPQLGSQIYAMAGMETKLHLQADHAGSYDGISANYSGNGFSGMKFKAIATTQEGFDAWVKKAQASSNDMTGANYALVATPSEAEPVAYYGKVQPALFEDIMNKYMPHTAMPAHGAGHGMPMPAPAVSAPSTVPPATTAAPMAPAMDHSRMQMEPAK
jgi:cytochrome o ubiquinol oxidase subunit 2